LFLPSTFNLQQNTDMYSSRDKPQYPTCWISPNQTKKCLLFFSTFV
jgi:hypothetical protein